MIFEEVNAVETPSWESLAAGVAVGAGASLLIVAGVALFVS